MAFDYFTLRTLAAELGPRVCGRRIAAAAPSPHGLALDLDDAGLLQVRPSATHGVILTPGPLDAAVPARDPGLPYLVNACVVDVSPDPRDRILRLRLERRTREGVASFGLLVVELFARGGWIVLVREQNGEVVAAWGMARTRPDRARPGTRYAAPAPGLTLLPGVDDRAAFAAGLAAATGPVGRCAAHLLAAMDRAAFAEICHRAGVSPDEPAAGLTPGAVDSLWERACEAYRSAPSAGAFVWHEGGPGLFSSLEPTRLAGAATHYATVSQAVLAAQQTGAGKAAGEPGARRLRERLVRLCEALARKGAAMRAELDEAQQAEALERRGTILMAWAHAVAPGQRSVRVLDVYDEAGQRQVEIPLDPERTPAENASRLLKAARRLQRRRDVLPQRLRQVEQQVAAAADLARELRAGRIGAPEVHAWLEENGMSQAGQGGRRRPPEEEAHPRRYRTSTGWSVWAGRNNQENDVLTHRLAAQNDVWFHAHGYPGSHVILRREGRVDEPDKRTLEAAAAVAAYWSKGRTARKVSVVYTLAKFVSKPRGSPAGQATLRRERTIMVAPALLPEEDQGVA